jgi:hypothetical protein
MITLDLEDLIDNDVFGWSVKQIVVLLAAREIKDLRKTRCPGSKPDRLCIPRNHTLGHIMLMRDYNTEVPTYPAHLFRHRIECIDLFFADIVKTCDAKCCYFKRNRDEDTTIEYVA